MELKIDGTICDLGSDPVAVPGYDAEQSETIDAAREGRSLTLEIPFSKRNDPLLGFARDALSAETFNKSLHQAELSFQGARLIDGTVRLLAVAENRYRIEIRSGGAQWAELAARSSLADLEIDWQTILTPTNLCNSWVSDDPVKFLPVHHDDYEQQNSSSDLLSAERILAVEDYHPFLHVAALVKQIFARAGYRIKSAFFDSELFQSLHMSGAYASHDTTAAVNRMGFSARRLNPVTASANESGRVWANPDALANTLGNIVETATPLSVDADGEAVNGLFNNGNCFSTDNGKIVFTPPTEVDVGFEYYLKYTTQHRILSRTRLTGFDTIYLGPNANFQFQLTNRYKDLRNEITNSFSYRAIVFNHSAGSQYRLTFTRDGVDNVVWATFASRSAVVTTPASGSIANPRLQIYNGSQWVDYTDDWALYKGYIGETGQTTVDVKLRSPSEHVTPASPKFFNQIYFSGAEEGMQITLHKECSLRPRFLAGPTQGSTVNFADVTRRDIRQADLLEALAHLFNLRFFTEPDTRTVWIEPEPDFYAGETVDWSRKTDFSQPVVREQIAPLIHETRTWQLQDGDGAVNRFNADEQTTLGAWSVTAGSYATLQGEKILRNPLFAPTLNSAKHYLNAPSALLPQVGDRDDAEDDGTNFSTRIVRYVGIKPLPDDERWGYPSGRNEYPLAAFLFAGDDQTEPFTLGFEDRDGAQGLHRYYDRQVHREAVGERVSLALKIAPHEFAALFTPGTGCPDIRSVFRIDTGNGTVRAILRRIEAYDPSKASVYCQFERIDQL